MLFINQDLDYGEEIMVKFHNYYDESGNLNNRPWIYFCCHPDDFSSYFESISRDILAINSNAVIWYSDKNVIRDEEYFEQLGLMKLFMMPVTTKLLTTSSDQLNRDFRFAMENHIPVFPIMTESGLEEMFNDRCGNLQFLDKTKKEATAISYKKKFEKYLTAIFADDLVTKKIKNEFKGKIFLSYRKKDRRQAQKLMHIIHKNKFCRDVAIWYDEFLTVGENFDESINEALNESDLFVLAVTPNLVIEKNYIMETEYPEARKRNKPVFPVKMQFTNEKLLKEKYKGIPDCIDCRYEEIVGEVVEELLKDAGVRDVRDSEDHNYLMGLAYMNGIDVETDYEMAVEMLSLANEEGNPDAMEKLIHIYKNGIGVPKDVEKTLELQEQQYLFYKNNINASYTYNISPGDFFWNVVDCGEIYANNGDTDKGLEKFRQAFELVQEYYDYVSEYMSSREKELNIFEYETYFCHISGDYLRNADRLEEALTFYEREFELMAYFEDLEDDNPFSAGDLLDCAERIAMVLGYVGRFKEAKAHFDDCLELREEFAEEYGDDESIIELALLYLYVGEMNQLAGKIADAKEYYAKFFATIERVNNSDDGRLLKFHSIYYSKTGFILFLEKNYDKAEENYMLALECCQKLVELSPTIDSYDFLQDCYNEIAGIYIDTQQFDKAEFYVRKTLNTARELLTKADTVSFQRKLAAAYYLYGLYECANGRYDNARRNYDKSLEIRERIWRDNGSLESRRDMAMTYFVIANSYYLERSFEKALVYFEKANEFNQALFDEVGMLSDAVQLSIISDRFSGLLFEMGKLDESIKSYKNTLDIHKYLVRKLGATANIVDLAHAYIRIGAICQQAGKYTASKHNLKKCIDLMKDLLKKEKCDEHVFILLDAYKSLANTYVMCDDYHEAGKYCAIACDMMETQVVNKNTKEYRLLYAELMDMRGFIAYAADDYEKAQEYYLISINELEQLVSEEKDSAVIGALSSAYVHMSITDPDICEHYLMKCISALRDMLAILPGNVVIEGLLKDVNEFLDWVQNNKDEECDDEYYEEYDD